MGIFGVGNHEFTAFSLSTNSNLKVDGNQISFGTIDFQPHPPTLTPVFANLDQEMDLTFGSLNFCIGSLDSILLSDLTKLGPSAEETASAVMPRFIGWLFQRGKPTGQLHTDGNYRVHNQGTRQNHGKPRLRGSIRSLR
jgi:hypothetical protein